MTKPRSHYVDSEHARYYHVTSRCVRRAWLLGIDPLTRVDHNHRKGVLLQRMQHLARYFAVQIMGYAIMSNHFHIVLHYDPKENDRWSDEQVAERWCAAFNGGSIADSPDQAQTLESFDVNQTIRYHTLLLDAERLSRCRDALGSLSCFMQHLKQRFSAWANHEERAKGCFFEKRFYSGALLTEEDLLACMAYVDLNPVEAGMARSLREAGDTSIYERLSSVRFDVSTLETYLAPLWSDAEAEHDNVTASGLSKRLPCTLREYATQLNLAITYLTRGDAELPNRLSSWMARLLNRQRKRRQTAPAFYDYV